MKKLYLGLAALAAAFAANAQTFFPNQDCSGAQPLCSSHYYVPDNQLIGPGRVTAEIPSGSCLHQGEHQTSWYTFQVNRSGDLSFIIIPTDADSTDLSGAGSSNTDYDWAVFRLPAGTTTSTGGCPLVAASSSTEAACNYSGTRGVTGLARNASSGAINAPVSAASGDIYVLAVDNFAATTVGYTIKFFVDSLGYASLGAPAPQAPPRLTIGDVYIDTTCVGNCPAYVTFSRPVNCALIDTAMSLLDSTRQRSSYAFHASCYFAGNPDSVSNMIRVDTDYPFRDSSYYFAISYTDTASTTTDGCGNLVVSVSRSDTFKVKPTRYRYFVATSKLSAKHVAIAPNPFHNQLTADLSGVSGACNLRMLTTTGQEVYTQAGLAGGKKVSINVPESLPPGVYIVELSNMMGTYHIRATKQ